MITLKHTEDMNLPRSVRSYIDSCATEFCYADESIKIAELAYRLKRGVDLLPVFIEDIKISAFILNDNKGIFFFI